MEVSTLERGVYFDAWYPRQHNYHPSLPPRRLGMIEDLVKYRATLLNWSALGGGSISLPYLEDEAWGEVPARYRQYGYLNDVEYIAECQKRGIKVFGIVFECQGCEFPVELNEAEDTILAMNETRGAGKRDWIGLREFTQDRYPKLWKSFRSYFPDGLVNSEGEEVTDILEECTARDIHGQPCHSQWVECPDRDHYCYNMDRNNPVWREYLKAIIRIQIDAGVAGVELDEADLPLTSLGYGGCFCKDCIKGFRAYIKALPELPEELAGVDLDQFQYGTWLLGQGFDFKSNRENTPLFWDYLRFQHRQVAKYFAELSDYAHEYARSKGRDVLVSGNFFELGPHYYPIEPKVDILITEMRDTGYRQPGWCRYCAGFAGDKPVTAVENPYGGVGPELLPKLQKGKAYDLFRMMTYEAYALGIGMSLPYGSWMGSVIEDALYAPHELCIEIGNFVADHEDLYSTRTHNETAVAFSIESNFRLTAHRGPKNRLPFWNTLERLSRAGQPLDVVMFPDGDLRKDTITGQELAARYRNLILPNCQWLTEAQADAILGFLDTGGRVLVYGDLGLNVAADKRDAILRHVSTTRLGSDVEFDVSHLPNGPQVRLADDRDLAVNVQAVKNGSAIHIIRYDYNESLDAVPVLPELKLTVRLPRHFRMAKAFSPEGTLEASVLTQGELHHLTLRNVPLYSVVLLQG